MAEMNGVPPEKDEKQPISREDQAKDGEDNITKATQQVKKEMDEEPGIEGQNWNIAIPPRGLYWKLARKKKKRTRLL